MPDTPVLFGAIADDYTGGADLASMLRNGGVSTVQVLGLQEDSCLQAFSRYQAIVISLKSRSLPVEQACGLSLRALHQLAQFQPRQIQLKYCSTFDSTTKGNIGPVADSLMESLHAGFTVAVPALPVNGRTQYMGHLFVGPELLSESHMRHHPVTPMTDSNLVRHLQAQSRNKVGLVPLAVVRRGAAAIQEECRKLQSEGVAIALVDAVSQPDLDSIAESVADFPFITGGSGLAMSLPEVWKRRGWLQSENETKSIHPDPQREPVLILAGSCSAMTLRQIQQFQDSGGLVLRIDVQHLATHGPEAEITRLLPQVESALAGNACVMAASSAGPEERSAHLAGSEGFPEEISRRIEQSLAGLAAQIVRQGLSRRMIIAGGETSGAAVDALGIQAVEVLETIAPGVPMLKSIGSASLALALKSGNFGGDHFFQKAVSALRTISLEKDR